MLLLIGVTAENDDEEGWDDHLDGLHRWFMGIPERPPVRPARTGWRSSSADRAPACDWKTARQGARMATERRGGTRRRGARSMAKIDPY